MAEISNHQRALFCIALAIKQGKVRHNHEAQSLAEKMSEEELRKLCEAPAVEAHVTGQKPETGSRRR